MLMSYGFMFVVLCFGTELLERVLQYLIIKIYIFLVIGTFMLKLWSGTLSDIQSKYS